jgi:hypothetical protein
MIRGVEDDIDVNGKTGAGGRDQNAPAERPDQLCDMCVKRGKTGWGAQLAALSH